MELGTIRLLLGSLMLCGLLGAEANSLFPNWAADCQYRQRDFRLIAKGLSDALNFFDSHIQELVLDAAVGTRILEGQIQVILESDVNVPTSVERFLRRTLRKSGRISESIIQNIKADQKISEQVKNSTLPWVTSTRLWNMPKMQSWKRLESMGVSESQPLTNETKEIMSEQISDACIGKLFQNCQVSSACQNLFLTRPHTLYSLTHQAIFLIITTQLDCNSVPEFRTKFPTGDSSEFHGSVCSKILMEANAISAQGFPEKVKDLFAEQVAVCSLAGYKDFLKPEWMYEILFWEKTLSTNSACFTSSDSDEETPVAKHLSGPEEIPGHRVKRSDVLIDLGIEADEQCSAHFTAVSISALAIHLRYLLETCLL